MHTYKYCQFVPQNAFIFYIDGSVKIQILKTNAQGEGNIFHVNAVRCVKNGSLLIVVCFFFSSGILRNLKSPLIFQHVNSLLYYMYYTVHMLLGVFKS